MENVGGVTDRGETGETGIRSSFVGVNPLMTEG